MSKNLLHLSHLEAFQRFLTGEFIAFRPGRGQFQTLQVQLSDGQWACVYSRLDMPEHYTVDRRLDKLVERFIRWKRNDSNARIAELERQLAANQAHNAFLVTELHRIEALLLSECGTGVVDQRAFELTDTVALDAVLAAERERCAMICDEIAEIYQESESRLWPELRTDAQSGAEDCAAAIRRGESK